jgi:nucleolar protein 56
MSAVDYLLHESSIGYAIFQVVHQADTVGNRLKEVQDASQDLAKFGKMVKLVNFAPYRYTIISPGRLIQLTFLQRSC